MQHNVSCRGKEGYRVLYLSVADDTNDLVVLLHFLNIHVNGELSSCILPMLSSLSECPLLALVPLEAKRKIGKRKPELIS